jgi:hypothetical protein
MGKELIRENFKDWESFQEAVAERHLETPRGRRETIEGSIQDVLDFMMKNYVEWSNWSSNYKPNAHSENMDVKNEMIHNYCNGLRVEEGRKYYKLIGSNGGGTQESVKGFVVKEDEKKFSRGDMLKAAGWKAPARNFSRGNVFRKDTFEDNVRWTGIG